MDGELSWLGVGAVQRGERQMVLLLKSAQNVEEAHAVEGDSPYGYLMGCCRSLSAK